MWYYIFRLIILIVVLLFMIRCFKKHKYMKTIIKIIMIILYVVLGTLLNIYPVEKSLIKFDTPDKAYDYTHFHHIFKQTESPNGAFIWVGENCDITGYTFIPKENDKYNFITPFTSITEKPIENDNIKVDQQISDKDQLIVVSIDNLKDIDNNYTITDSANSQYTYFYCKYKKEFNYKKFYYTIVDSKDINVFVNGELIK